MKSQLCSGSFDGIGLLFRWWSSSCQSQVRLRHSAQKNLQAPVCLRLLSRSVFWEDVTATVPDLNHMTRMQHGNSQGSRFLYKQVPVPTCKAPKTISACYFPPPLAFNARVSARYLDAKTPSKPEWLLLTQASFSTVRQDDGEEGLSRPSTISPGTGGQGPLAPGPGGSDDVLLDSVVKIFTVATSPNYLLPWQNKPQREITGSGFAIAGRRILTNAHVVADQTYVLVRKHGSPRRFRARVAAVAHECDLALLRISEAEEGEEGKEEGDTCNPSHAQEKTAPAIGQGEDWTPSELPNAYGTEGYRPLAEESGAVSEADANAGHLVTQWPEARLGCSATGPVLESAAWGSAKEAGAVFQDPEEEFWEGVSALELGDVPNLQEEVAVVGYPQGGDNISITAGVVSRVEPTQYAHSAAHLLAIQIDAAINPGNSGGPALMMSRDRIVLDPQAHPAGDGAWAGGGAAHVVPPIIPRVAGVAFQNLAGAENIGYIIPVPVIRRFLEDADAGETRFRGFVSLGVVCQPLENSQLRGLLQVPRGVTGVVVNVVQPLSAANGVLAKDDVITAVDGVAIANDGSVPFRKKERLPFDCLVALKSPSELTRVSVMRSGGPIEFELQLRPVSPLVPTQHFDMPPSYFIFAGLVFVPLTQSYLHEYGPDWFNTSPRRLCDRALRGIPSAADQQVVILSRVLTDQINSGFERLAELEVKRVNGSAVTNLRSLRELVRSCTEEFLRIDLDDERVVAVNVAAAKSASARILRRYRVPCGVSQDLLPTDARSDSDRRSATGVDGEIPGAEDCEWWESSSKPER